MRSRTEESQWFWLRGFLFFSGFVGSAFRLVTFRVGFLLGLALRCGESWTGDKGNGVIPSSAQEQEWEVCRCRE